MTSPVSRNIKEDKDHLFLIEFVDNQETNWMFDETINLFIENEIHQNIDE